MVRYNRSSKRWLADAHSRPVVSATTWESATPYIATRYAKTRGRQRCDLRSASERAEFLLQDLREEIRRIIGVDPDSAHLELIADEHSVFRMANRWRPIQFKRHRNKPSDDGGRRLAGAFRLHFQQPVTGPIALGHSSHFGMGLFTPAESTSGEE